MLKSEGQIKNKKEHVTVWMCYLGTGIFQGECCPVDCLFVEGGEQSNMCFFFVLFFLRGGLLFPAPSAMKYLCNKLYIECSSFVSVCEW